MDGHIPSLSLQIQELQKYSAQWKPVNQSKLQGIIQAIPSASNVERAKLASHLYQEVSTDIKSSSHVQVIYMLVASIFGFNRKEDARETILKNDDVVRAAINSIKTESVKYALLECLKTDPPETALNLRLDADETLPDIFHHPCFQQIQTLTISGEKIRELPSSVLALSNLKTLCVVGTQLRDVCKLEKVCQCAYPKATVVITSDVQGKVLECVRHLNEHCTSKNLLNTWIPRVSLERVAIIAREVGLTEAQANSIAKCLCDHDALLRREERPVAYTWGSLAASWDQYRQARRELLRTPCIVDAVLEEWKKTKNAAGTNVDAAGALQKYLNEASKADLAEQKRERLMLNSALRKRNAVSVQRNIKGVAAQKPPEALAQKTLRTSKSQQRPVPSILRLPVCASPLPEIFEDERFKHVKYLYVQGGRPRNYEALVKEEIPVGKRIPNVHFADVQSDDAVIDEWVRGDAPVKVYSEKSPRVLYAD